MEKVFCKDCIFFDGKFQTPYMVLERLNVKELVQADCTHYLNIKKEIIKETWYEQEIVHKYIKEPRELNKNNDCKYYDSKEK